ncbi:hypothetical protein PVAP13_9NG521714 [Panicum virgatum]|uniref:Uncharacterized protein n=1 Tax=Panicum virgatum TaxID=38727 RepID=A0A8T0MTY4_PANVG|nr:hypothetical protein PVAP13_9NG521714 [Panicum virgatum]
MALTILEQVHSSRVRQPADGPSSMLSAPPLGSAPAPPCTGGESSETRVDLTSCAALAVRFIRAEAECAREASGSCDELAAPPFHLLHGEYAGDEEVATPSSAALRSPASWGTPESRGQPRRGRRPSFRLHRGRVRRRREGKPRLRFVCIEPESTGEEKGSHAELAMHRHFTRT